MDAMRRAVLIMVALSGITATSAAANTSHDGWPRINGMLLMNKTDLARPLDARPGHDPFGGTDPRYSCDAVHKHGSCHKRMVHTAAGVVVTDRSGHNELLGGHGNDALYAGPWGDVLWADYKPSGQPSSQVDNVRGGAGKDFIYASHGTNVIDAGPGADYVKAHFGRGTIDCGRGNDILYVSRKAQRHYKIRNCDRISHKTLGR
jgi:Ca2+-binding RTX toxin-like protein